MQSIKTYNNVIGKQTANYFNSLFMFIVKLYIHTT